MTIQQSVLIHRPAGDVYSYWRDITNLAGLAPANAVITQKSKTRSLWKIQLPVGAVEWETEIKRDVPDREIAWASMKEASIANNGSVHFTSLDANTTRTDVCIEYDVGSGVVGEWLTHLSGRRAEEQVRSGLKRMKRALEANATTHGASSVSSPRAHA